MDLVGDLDDENVQVALYIPIQWNTSFLVK